MISKSSLYKTAIFLLIMVGYVLLFQQFKTIEVNSFVTSETAINDSGFNSKRAFEDLSYLLLFNNKELPHPVDSLENQLVASRLISTMRLLGYQEEIQQQEFCLDHVNGSAKCAQIKNIVYRINGTDHTFKKNLGNSNQAILVSAHYDSVNAAPGASDAGTAVAALIEIARLMAKQPKALNDIIFLFNDGEEAGLLGARAFMQSHRYANEIKWVLNLDAIGSSGRSLMIETGKSNGELIDVFSNVNKYSNLTPIASSFISFLWENMPSDTDMTIFKQHGLSGLNFINLERSAHYHTPLDNLSNVDLGSLQEHGNHLWALLQELKNKPIIENSFVDQQIYQDVIGYGIIHWNQTIGIVISLVTFILFIGMMILLKRDIYRFWYSLFLTLFAFTFILAISIISSVVLKKGIQLVSFQLNGSSEPWFSDFLPMQMFLIAGTFTISRFCYEFVKNFVCYPLLTILWALTLSSFALVCALSIPKLSAIFIISSVLSLAILAPVFITRYRNNFISERTIYRVTGMLLTVIAIFIFAPSLYLLEVMMTFYWTPVIGLFIAIVFISGASVGLAGEQNNSLAVQENKSLSNYLRQLEFMSLDKAVLVILFFSTAAWVLLNPIYTTNTPNSLNLQYLQLNSSGAQKQQAFILIGSKYEKLNNGLASELNKNGDLTITKTKAWSSTQYINVPVKSLKIKPTAITLISDEKNNGSRVVRIQLDGNGVVVNDIKLFFPLNTKLKKISTGSNIINYENDKLKDRVNYGYHCVGQACGNLVLDIEIERDSPFSLKLIETRKDLPSVFNNFDSLRGGKLIEKGKGDRQIISQTFYL